MMPVRLIYAKKSSKKSGSTTRKSSKEKRGVGKGRKGGASPSRPNIIFMLADDLGWGSGGFGESADSDIDFASPNLNKMSEAGIKMTQYYTQEVCTPGRASLMTGRYPLTIGMQYGGIEATSSWGLNKTEVTIANVLQDDGYTNYQIGKWNLGHFSAGLLPGSRGFNYWLSYQTGSMFYWSKKDPESKTGSTYFKQLIYGDNTCYSGYSGTDEHDYSTFLFRDKAIKAISGHNYDDAPMFMYLAFQAVHDPFTDFKFPNGVPKSYIEDNSINKKIKTEVTGRKRRQYAMSLYLMDDAVGKIVDAVEDAGQSDNTYFIFTSDNGGCYDSGGRNGPLKGNKGSLFEGGTKVDALVYSAALKSSQQGTSYTGLMHVSDWFPTILDMTGVDYTPSSSNSFDGVSHWLNMQSLDGSTNDDAMSSPRTVMLYNYYTDVKEQDGWLDTPVRAVRDSQYKLIESWENNYSGYFWPDTTLEDDRDLLQYGSCQQPNSWESGTYTQYLFDLKNDPYETVNLWGLKDLESVQASLYAHLDVFLAGAKEDENSYGVNSAAFKKFTAAGGYIVPWEKPSDETSGTPMFVKAGCDQSYVSPENLGDEDFTDTDPTMQPTNAPSMAMPTYTSKLTRNPTPKPSKKPTHKPTKKPTGDDQINDDLVLPISPSPGPTSSDDDSVGPPTKESETQPTKDHDGPNVKPSS